jgi:Cytochrome P460
MLRVFGRHWRLSLWGCAAVVCLSVADPMRGQAPSGGEPRYTADGDLLFPQGFETWIFVGSNLGLSYRSDLPMTTLAESARASPQFFHNVYVAREAYSYFLANKVFPDKTILVMELYEATDKEPKNVLASGLYNGKRVGVEAAVKNSARPDGAKTLWAYYDFTDQTNPSGVAASARAFSDRQCENCHRDHAGTDHVWVQFYPPLRDKK